MSEQERQNVNRALLAFGSVLVSQTVAVTWWAATLQAQVTHNERQINDLSPRVEMLEADYFRRGGDK